MHLYGFNTCICGILLGKKRYLNLNDQKCYNRSVVCLNFPSVATLICCVLICVPPLIQKRETYQILGSTSYTNEDPTTNRKASHESYLVLCRGKPKSVQDMDHYGTVGENTPCVQRVHGLDKNLRTPPKVNQDRL